MKIEGKLLHYRTPEHKARNEEMKLRDPTPSHYRNIFLCVYRLQDKWYDLTCDAGDVGCRVLVMYVETRGLFSSCVAFAYQGSGQASHCPQGIARE